MRFFHHVHKTMLSVCKSSRHALKADETNTRLKRSPLDPETSHHASERPTVSTLDTDDATTAKIADDPRHFLGSEREPQDMRAVAQPFAISFCGLTRENACLQLSCSATPRGPDPFQSLAAGANSPHGQRSAFHVASEGFVTCHEHVRARNMAFRIPFHVPSR